MDITVIFAHPFVLPFVMLYITTVSIYTGIVLWKILFHADGNKVSHLLTALARDYALTYVFLTPLGTGNGRSPTLPFCTAATATTATTTTYARENTTGTTS